MAVFDDVMVPWSGVSSTAMRRCATGCYDRTGAMPQVMHQFSTKNLAKSGFMMGLAFAIAKSTNIDQHLHVQGMLAELIQFTEFCRACLRASEADAAAERGRRGSPASDAAVDGAHDVRQDVPAHVRDRADAGRRRAGSGAVVSARCKARSGRMWRPISRLPMPGAQSANRAVPAGVRRGSVFVFRAPAALRTILFG